MKVRAHDLRPGPYIGRRTAMGEYIGLDVSLKETAVSIRRDGKRIWRGKCCETSCRDVGRPTPRHSLHHAHPGMECVMNLGEVAPRSPIMRRHMPTAKTTMLPATASQKTLAPNAIRRRMSEAGKPRIAREWLTMGRFCRWQPSTT
jgi:hypothetical protein